MRKAPLSPVIKIQQNKIENEMDVIKNFLLVDSILEQNQIADIEIKEILAKNVPTTSSLNGPVNLLGLGI